MVVACILRALISEFPVAVVHAKKPCNAAVDHASRSRKSEPGLRNATVGGGEDIHVRPAGIVSDVCDYFERVLVFLEWVLGIVTRLVTVRIPKFELARLSFNRCMFNFARLQRHSRTDIADFTNDSFCLLPE